MSDESRSVRLRIAPSPGPYYSPAETAMPGPGHVVSETATAGPGQVVSAQDEGRRCDLEAGMAKLLAARVAWSAADNAVQIHGGNGFALEFPISRVLCDARILNIFEGAAEIQAQVIARRLLQNSVN